MTRSDGTGLARAGAGTAFVATPPDVRLAFFSAIGAIDLSGDLAAVSVPTTVVVGSRDRLTPPRRARAGAAAVPGARLVEVPDAGHMLPYETPDLLADLVAAAGDRPPPAGDSD